MSKLFALWQKLIDKLNTKADLVDGKVPTEQLPDDIGGGVSSWNDLEDKPFGESKAFEDIIWDGNTEGLLSISMDMGGVIAYWYRVSDKFISDSDSVIGACYLPPAFMSSSGVAEETIVDDYYVAIHKHENGSFAIANTPDIVSVNTPNTSFSVNGTELTFPAEGIWFMAADVGNGLEGIQYLKASASIKHLDEKYIPDSIARDTELEDLSKSVDQKINDAISSIDNSLTTAIGSGVLE